MRERNKKETVGPVQKVLIALTNVLLAFCVAFAFAYVNRCLEDADKLVIQRTMSTAEMLKSKVKSLLMAGNMLYADTGVFDWINAREITSEMDIKMVKTTGDFLRTNPAVKSLILYNVNTGYLYATDHYKYRDADQYPEKSVLELIRDNISHSLRLENVAFGGTDALALRLPHTLKVSAPVSSLVLIYDREEIANSVSTLFTRDVVDGSVTFVMTSDSHRAVMGIAPEAFTGEEEITESGQGLFALWASFFRSGRLMHSAEMPQQGWTVYSVLHVDSFLSAYMPFVRIVLLGMAALLVILLVLILSFSRLMRRPYSALAKQLQDKLPAGTVPAPNVGGPDNQVLTELQAGINYLLGQITALDDIDHGDLLSSQLTAWVNTLGAQRQSEINLSRFFPKPRLQMGLARISGYDSYRLDYFARRALRQEVGDALRAELNRCWQTSSCVGTGDGCFVLLVNDVDMDEARLTQTLTDASRRMESAMHTTVYFAVSPVMDRGNAHLPEMYRQLYDTTFLCFVSPGKPVCTLQEYEEFRRQNPRTDDKSAFERVLRQMRSADASAVAQAVSDYCALLVNMPFDQARGSVNKLLFALLTQYGKSFTPEDYQKMQNFLSDCKSLEDAEKRLESMCVSVAAENEKMTDRSSQWQEIVLNISEYIQNNIADPQLSVEMLAQREGYSINYIRSMFKTYVGVSISDYIRQKRVSTACQLLTSSNAPIQRIMECCGFCNRSSFFTLFKSMMGVTPSEYRQAHGDGGEKTESAMLAQED